LRDIVFAGKNTFTAFTKSPENIATNILSDRLELLQTEEIILKIGEGHAKYELTEKGKDLVPLLVEMIIWDALHDPQTSIDQKVLTEIQANKSKFTKDARSGKVSFQMLMKNQ